MVFGQTYYKNVAVTLANHQATIMEIFYVIVDLCGSHFCIWLDLLSFRSDHFPYALLHNTLKSCDYIYDDLLTTQVIALLASLLL